MTIERAKLIRDEPAEEDEFFGAGHQRSAQALAEAVKQLNERDGAIGLEGPWGSGKSTVINLAANKFAENGDEQYKVFTFDLWLHNPDILKLAFLEEFIAWSRKESLLPDKQAEEFSKEIADREISTRIENKREFNWGGILFLIIFPLLPVVYTWLSPLAFSNRAAPPAWTVPWLGWQFHPSILALLGLGALYLIFLLTAVAGLRSHRKQGLRSALSGAARLFTKETDFDEIQQWIRERNPTSEEFQTFFRRIVSVAQSSGTRIVFVFDNIDRLPSKSVQKVWSEARSIFAMASRGEKPDNSSITAIVPYDSKYISEAFEDKGEQDRPDSERAEHLIRKTFDITLRVAPPLSTDWKKFLDAKLDFAFPTQLGETDKYELFKLFDVHKQVSGLPPTPREIISYINQVGSIWNEWGDKIPVSHMAIFALTNRVLSPETIKSGGFINHRFRPLIRDKEVAKSLAALHFNVEPEHAYQILLGQDIERIAVVNNPAEFLELTESNGFEEVFPDVLRDRVEQWAKDGAEKISNLAHNLTQEGVSGDYLREVWSHLSEALPYLEGCNARTPEAYTGLSEIIARVDEETALSRSTQLMSWYSRHIPEPNERTELLGRCWFRFFAPIYDAVSGTHGESSAEDFQGRVAFPEGIPFSIGVCAECSTHKAIGFGTFKRTHKAAELQAATSQLVSSSPETLQQILKFKPWYFVEETPKAIASAICDRLFNEPLDETSRPLLVEALCTIRCKYDKKGEARTPIAQRAADGTLFAHTASSLKAEDLTTAARIVWLITDSTDGNVIPGNPANHAKFGDINPQFTAYKTYVNELKYEDESTAQIAKLAAVSDEFTKWMNYALTDGKPEFFRVVFRRLVRDEDYKTLATGTVIGKYDELRKILEADEVAAFHEKFSGWDTYFEKHVSGEDSLNIPISLLDAIERGEAKKLRKLVELVDAHLESLSEEDWSSVLDEENEELGTTLFSRLESGSFRPQLEPFRTVLFGHCLEMLEGKKPEPRNAKKWALFFQGMRKDTREKFARDLLVKLNDVTTTSDGVKAFVSTAPEIAEIFPIVDYADIALDQVVTPAVLVGAQQTESFLESRSADIKATVFKSSNAAKARFTEALESVRDAEGGQTDWVSEWAQKLGVVLSTPDEDTNSDGE